MKQPNYCTRKECRWLNSEDSHKHHKKLITENYFQVMSFQGEVFFIQYMTEKTWMLCELKTNATEQKALWLADGTCYTLTVNHFSSIVS